MEYSVNKGAGNPVEFKGLKSQYLFVFAGGLVTVLLAVVILYLAGVDQWICIPFGTVSGGLLAWAVFRLNARYGEHGLMKLLAEKRHPRYLIHRKRVFRLFAKEKTTIMRNVLKAETLERKFPLLSVENGCIVSKDADLTVAFEVELPELYTVTAEEYEAMHSTWIKAARVLPEHSIVCKQDWFTKESYRPQNGGEEQSFLSRSYERHFNERPYLNHRCYLYLTKTTRERNRRQSDFSTLCRGFLLPREITDKDMAARFLEAVEQFEHIVNDSGHIRLRRLETEEITGTKERPGLVEKYLSLSMEDGTAVLQDICLKPGRMRIGDKRLCLHTLSDTEDLPGKLSTDMRYERMSTDRSDCRLSFAAPVGLLLSCNHIYSQYVFIDNAQEILQMMEKNSRNMLSLSRYSRSNAVNQEWTEMYLDEAHTKGVLPVRCHCNVIAWAEDAEEFRRIRNDTGSQLAMMECTPRYNTVDTPVLYWTGIPGNAGDFPAEESFYTFLEQAVCLFAGETNYRSSPSPFGIRMADRQNGIPVHVDISDLPMKRGIITNRNKFILGPSGSGKSFSPTIWCATITSRERISCWWTRATAIRGCAG